MKEKWVKTDNFTKKTKSIMLTCIMCEFITVISEIVWFYVSYDWPILEIENQSITKWTWDR